MKASSSIAAFFLILLPLFACTDRGSPVAHEISEISGEWTWVKSTGGFFPRLITPDSSQVIKDVYRPNGSFYRFRNDSLIVSAHFTISESESMRLRTLIDIEASYGYNPAGLTEPIQVTVRADTLIVGFSCCDTFQDWFVRTRQFY